jgi:DNA repair protein RadC
MSEENLTGIKSWAEADRPREKLLEKGRHTLTDSELLAILIRSGSREESAVELSKKILHDVKNDLAELSRMSVADLSKYKGMGQVKAITIVAALELGRRRAQSVVLQKQKISTSKDVYDYFTSDLSDLRHEVFYVLLLDRANQIMKHIKISEGGVAGTAVDSKIIFKHALENLASGLILCHNHPSRNPQPSQQDIDLTKKLTQAGKVLDVDVLDHIIIAGNNYFSFGDEGLM